MSVFSHKPGRPVTRREALSRAGNGFGMMAFASLLNTSILRAGISTPDGGGIMTAHRQRLFDSNTQSVPAMAGAEFEQFDHLPCTLGSAMPQVQCVPQLIEGCRPSPRLPPLCQRSRAHQCARLLAQHVQIMLQIEYLLLSAVAAIVPGNTLASMT